MDREERLQLLRDLNPQWQALELELEDFLIERDALTALRERTGVNAIVGLRRAGKTTLLRQYMAEVGHEIGYERTCYWSFDLEGVDVRDVVEDFCEEVLREPVNDLSGPVHFFFDEVQNRAAWSGQVKHYVDHYDDLEFTVTGSSAVNVLKGGGESLAGRLTTQTLHPFKFREYLRYHGVQRDRIDFTEGPLGDRAARIRFADYLDAGGMPEVYRYERPVERLEETIDLVFYRDIIELFDAARSSVLQGMFRSFASNTGQVVNFNSLSNSLDADFRTVKKYLDYLEDSFLVATSAPYTASAVASMRKNPKVYIADHAYNRIYPTATGLKAETVAYNHLKRFERPYFLKDPETDIVLPDAGQLFEVKYQADIATSDLQSLAENARRTGFDPFVVSKNTHETRTVDGQDIQLVPLYAVCLAV